jgi:hypothetical protein
MADEDLTEQLMRLLTGLAEEEVRAGKEFSYDGATLHSDEVSDLLLPSVLCIAQDLSDRVGLNRWGYHFDIVAGTGIGFPLAMKCEHSQRCFLEVAPFVVEVFDSELMDCHADLARLFEAAARLIRPQFSLSRDTNYAELAT